MALQFSGQGLPTPLPMTPPTTAPPTVPRAPPPVSTDPATAPTPAPSAVSSPRGDLPLHAEVNLLTPCTRTEFEAALQCCDTAAWITGLHSKFKGRLWNINDAGEAVLGEL